MIKLNNEYDSPSFVNKELKEIHEKIKICKDFYAGNVVNNQYLPEWEREKDYDHGYGYTSKAYKSRLNDTCFFNFFAPLIEAIVGFTIKKEPIIEGYKGIDLENIDQEGNNILVFIQKAIRKSLISGISFVAIQSIESKQKTYLKLYEYDQLTNYRINYNEYSSQSNIEQITFKEKIKVPKGQFGDETKKRFIFFNKKGGELWYSEEDGAPPIKKEEWSNKLGVVPVVPLITGKIIKELRVVPKFLDLALLNKQHLNLKSFFASILPIISNPVPVLYGDSEKQESINVNINNALLLNDKTTQGFEYIEVTGNSIKKLQEEIINIENEIDKLSYGLLIKNNNLTILDAQENKNKIESFLTDINNETETKFRLVLELLWKLNGKRPNNQNTIEFQKDFNENLVDVKIAADVLFAGDMSRETFYEILKNKQLPRDFDAKKESERIEEENKGIPEEKPSDLGFSQDEIIENENDEDSNIKEINKQKNKTR